MTKRKIGGRSKRNGNMEIRERKEKNCSEMQIEE